MAIVYSSLISSNEMWSSIGGPLIDVLRNRQQSLPFDQVTQVFYQTCKAVQHMHLQQPPIIHRDLKVWVVA